MVALNDINASAYKYLISVKPQFAQIRNPLHKLGIPYFSYFKVFKDGSYVFLTDHLELPKPYLENTKKYGTILVNEVERMQNNKSHYFLWPQDIKKISKRDNISMHIVHSHNVWNIFSIFKPSKLGFIECYHFAAKRNEEWDSGFYLNHIPLLESFVDYFTERAINLTDVNDKTKLAYFEHEFNFYKRSKEDMLAEKIEQFLKEVLIQKRAIKGKDKQIKLAPREAECLQYLALGNSIKEISTVLDLSPRTIEFYLRKIKQKTGYQSKAELLTNYIENTNWKLYPFRKC